jgi:hypothetical protein
MLAVILSPEAGTLPSLKKFALFFFNQGRKQRIV